MKSITFFTAIGHGTSGKHRRGACAIIFALCLMSVLAAPAQAQSSSPHAGRYGGEWVVTTSPGEDHTGTWEISIARDGGIKGTESDKTSKQQGRISGFIDKDGYVEVFLKYPGKTYPVRGSLRKRGSHLAGTLKQFSGNRVILTFDIILRRVSGY